MADFNTESLFTRSAHGIAALMSRAFFLNIFSYVTSLVIFTYLRPADIGIYAVVLAMQRIISFVTDFGFGAALIQKKDNISNDDLKTTFTIQAASTLFIFLVVLFLRDYFMTFFSLSTTALGLFLVLVFTLFLSSFKVIPSILLEREIKYHTLVLPQIAESLVFNGVLVILVLRNFGLESYSWAFLISAIVGLPIYYIVSPWRISLGISKKSLHHLWFGLQFQTKNILATIKDDLLTVFLTKVLTFKEIGYIGFGQRNAFFAYRYIVDSVTKVTFSTYSRMQDEKEMLKRAIEKSIFYISFIMFPVMVGTIIIAPYLIRLFPRWQGKWEPAVISLTFFCLNALISSISGVLVNVLDATGHVKTTLRLMVMWTLLTWILTPLGIYYFGFNGVAIVSFLVSLTIGVTIYFVKKITPISLFASIKKPIVGTIVMGLFTYLLSFVLAKNLPGLAFVIALSGIMYVYLMYLLAKSELFGVFSIFFKKNK